MEEDVNPTSQEALSQCLYQAMERAGASTKKECSTTLEIIESIIQDHLSRYICGSRYEGTHLPGMGSDIDIVLMREDVEVKTNLQECPQLLSMLLIQDDFTPPGYCKLQPVLNGVPVDKFHFDNNPVIHLSISKLLEAFKIGTDVNGMLLCGHPLLENVEWGFPTETHGPALQAIDIKNKSLHVDAVLAFRCRCLPKEAMKWFTRDRPYGWPSQEVIEQCQNLGFFVVPVGHPKSKEKYKQWRISLSLQERMLVAMFNSVQLKCFVLMKVLKNEVINKKLGKKVLPL